MTFQQAKETAARYGAEQPAFGPSSPAAPAWIDAVARLPLADDEELPEAIAEANRHSGL
jgi:hypothetical protein